MCIYIGTQKLDMKYTKKREIGVNKEIRSSLDDLHYFAITFWLMNESGQMYERSRRAAKALSADSAATRDEK